MSEARVILGIDLGTTNSLAAVMTPAGPRVLTDAQGRELIPSVVTFLPSVDGVAAEVVGHEAKALALSYPERTIASIKRLMGQTGAEVDAEAQRLAYRVEHGPRGLARVRIDERLLSPEEISARVLRKVKDVAEQALGRPVTDAVITVPAYFDDAQRQATKDAAQIAGLRALRILNEPTAASLAYGIDGQKDGVVAVYDLGGGTFDVSILKIQQGVFQVLSTCGDTHLGGDDFDRALMDLILTRIEAATGARVVDRPEVLQAVRKSAEGLKIRLSDAEQATLQIETGAAPLRIDVTRAQFEDLIRADVERTVDACRKALKDAKVKPGAIQEVVLVGGSTRIPMVRRRVAEFFGRPPHTDVNPDLAVALGAAIQAGILAGENQSLLLLDVIPLSLGLETMGGAFTKLILRNTTVPCSATEEFSTQVDNQTGVDINIYQGERELVQDCRLLGAFKLRGIPPMPAGLPRVQVTFLVNADGVLTVTARELRSGKSAQIDVVPSHGLTQDEVKKMLMASIDFADQDIQARELLELRNKAQTLVHGTERALELAGPGVAPEQSFTIKRLVKRVKQHLPGSDFAALKAAVEELSGATTQIADDLIGAAVKRALTDKPE